jgi:hypothetical protein
MRAAMLNGSSGRLTNPQELVILREIDDGYHHTDIFRRTRELVGGNFRVRYIGEESKHDKIVAWANSNKRW